MPADHNFGLASELGVGIHHSSPRDVCMYSGQRRSTGGQKSGGSKGATHSDPPTPPPVRSLNSALALSSSSGCVNRSSSVAAIVLLATNIPGSMISDFPPSALVAQAGYV